MRCAQQWSSVLKDGHPDSAFANWVPFGDGTAKGMTEPISHREFFLIRLTAERDQDGMSSIWVLRGQIEHPRTGQTWRFLQLNDLTAILSGWFKEVLSEISDGAAKA